MLRRPCIVANWKMNGPQTMLVNLTKKLLQASEQLTEIDIVLCPPAPYLQEIESLIHAEVGFALGAQNVYCEAKGAFTGEISTEMLVDVGCRYVILGHSERRNLFLETDSLIARKFVAAYHAGLTPILCVGETRAEREQGRTLEVVCRQLDAVLAEVPIGVFSRALLAYEPVWAIGTGLTATPLQAEEVHGFIRNRFSERDPSVAEELRILYGGSVKQENADGLFCMRNIDGGLIGGASLNAEEFLKICHSLTVKVV